MSLRPVSRFVRAVIPKSSSSRSPTNCPSVVTRHVNVTQDLSASRSFHRLSHLSSKELNSPVNPNDMHRSGGIASMMRLPIQKDTTGLDACFVGIPLDCGTSNRSGTKLGPRQIRTESVIIRPYNLATGAAPFESLQVADIGDIPANPYNLPVAVRQIRAAFDDVIKDGCVPLTMGGDHTISYPILQAIKDKYGPVCLIHIDAHSDTSDSMMGEKIAHGTPFRRAIEEGCLDCTRSVQIGLRGSGYLPTDYKWVQDQGVKVVLASDCWYKSLSPLMAEMREKIGDRPVYISFDIDGLDPAYAPGTGTPEIAGLTPIQGLEIVRGCAGMRIVGGDLVEVSPPYDQNGTTALTAANLLHEMLCVLPGVKFYK